MTASRRVIIVGLGAMGSAAAYHLARRGVRVLGFDRWAPPHANGSSHGRSRIIREAYFEHPLYVPLVRRAFENWDALERESGRRLYTRTGALMLGAAGSTVVAGTRASAREHGLAVEELSAAELARRFPAWHPPADTLGVVEARAGVLAPEAAVAAHLDLAGRAGAELRVNEPVLSWRAAAGGVEVTTNTGVHRADRLVLSAGAWTGGLVRELDLPLVVERNVMFWFRPVRRAAWYAPERFPVFLHEYAPGRFWYGLPDLGDGVKVAFHHGGETVDPDAARRPASAAEIAAMRALVRPLLPDLDGPPVESAACVYTDTPDSHFVVDVHPRHPEVVIASPCSGHGFKFSSVIGEILADLAVGERPPFDLTPFRLGRFG